MGRSKHGNAKANVNLGKEWNAEEIRKKNSKKVTLLFYVATGAVVLAFTPISALQTLQTSVNIEQSVGAIALTAGYIASILFGLLCTPILLGKYSLCVPIILGDISFLIYGLSNFYPNPYVLTFGAVVSCVGRATYGPSMSSMDMRLAKVASELDKSRNQTSHFDRLQSQLYTVLESLAVFGNLLSYGILYGSEQLSTDQETNTNETSTQQVLVKLHRSDNNSLYAQCGVNDCQDPTAVNENIDNYVPPDKTSVYVLISVCSVLNLMGLLVHCFIFPGVGAFGHKLTKIRNNAEPSDSSSQGCGTERENDVEEMPLGSQAYNKENERQKAVACYNNPSMIDGDIRKDFRDEGVETTSTKRTQSDPGRQSNLEETSSISDISDRHNDQTEVKPVNRGYLGTLKATFWFFVGLRPILLGPSALRCGLIIGFCFSDMTRAYASCVAGVQMTGLFAMTFGVASMFAAFIYGKLLPHLGRNILHVISTAIELCVYAIAYKWIPNPDTIGWTYAIFVGCGLVNGLLRQNIIGAFAKHFPNVREIAFSVFNVWLVAGVGIEYGFSTFMCVIDKIYFQVVIICIAFSCYVTAEVMYRRRHIKESNRAVADGILTTVRHTRL